MRMQLSRAAVLKEPVGLCAWRDPDAVKYRLATVRSRRAADAQGRYTAQPVPPQTAPHEDMTAFGIELVC